VEAMGRALDAVSAEDALWFSFVHFGYAHRRSSYESRCQRCIYPSWALYGKDQRGRWSALIGKHA
jgi:hypothetical protein